MPGIKHMVWSFCNTEQYQSLNLKGIVDLVKCAGKDNKIITGLKNFMGKGSSVKKK